MTHNYIADMESIQQGLRNEGYWEAAKNLGDRVIEGSTGGEILMGVRYELRVILRDTPVSGELRFFRGFKG